MRWQRERCNTLLNVSSNQAATGTSDLGSQYYHYTDNKQLPMDMRGCKGPTIYHGAQDPENVERYISVCLMIHEKLAKPT